MFKKQDQTRIFLFRAITLLHCIRGFTLNMMQLICINRLNFGSNWMTENINISLICVTFSVTITNAKSRIKNYLITD